MANPDPSDFNELLQAHATEDDSESESETEYDNTTDYESEDDDEEEPEADSGRAPELILVEESPPRVSVFGHTSVEGEKRRRVDGGGENFSVSGTENGECSQDSQWNQGDVDGLSCPICMDVWTNSGGHHISCLPCGHVYGFSCIKKWLQQRRNSGKCPQCNRKCSLKDVRKLFASRIVAVDEEAQKRIRYLESKCASLEKKSKCASLEKKSAAEWSKIESEWKKIEAELHFKVEQLEKRAVILESLLEDRQSRRHGFVAGIGGLSKQSTSGPNLGSSRGGSCLFVLQERLPTLGARLFDVNASSQILLMARKLPGIAGTHLLTKISLIQPHDSEDILLPPSTKAIKDLHFSPFDHNLALFSSLGKKLSILSMESKNVILNYDLPAAAWSCSWDSSSAHYVYAGLQNGVLMVFDMRQTASPVESLQGPTSNPIHTIHSLLHGSTFPSGVRALLSASSVGVCHWEFGGAEVRPQLVPGTENQGVCISLAYFPSSDNIVASFRPRVDMFNEVVSTQPASTPSSLVGQGTVGSRILIKKEGHNNFQKMGSFSATVNDIRLPKSTIIDIGNQKQLFASAEAITTEVVLHELPSFSAVQYLETQNHPVCDVKYTNFNSQGLLSCASEDALQLYTCSLSQ